MVCDDITLLSLSIFSRYVTDFVAQVKGVRCSLLLSSKFCLGDRAELRNADGGGHFVTKFGAVADLKMTV